MFASTIARRAALAVSALAFVVSVASAPVSAFAASNQDRPPTPKTPTPYIIYPPDVQVISLGTVHHADTADGYMFKVRNVGQGPAKKVVLHKETTVRKQSDDSFINKDKFDFTHPTPMNPGDEFMVEVSCSAHGPQYCDYGRLVVTVEQIVQDTNNNNNSYTNETDVYSKPQL
jgi:hypothetical protein